LSRISVAEIKPPTPNFIPPKNEPQQLKHWLIQTIEFGHKLELQQYY